jgi:hypothetical protein
LTGLGPIEPFFKRPDCVRYPLQHLQGYLRGAPRTVGKNQGPFRRQCPPDEYYRPHYFEGRTPYRRIVSHGRCAARGWFSCQRHHPSPRA